MRLPDNLKDPVKEPPGLAFYLQALETRKTNLFASLLRFADVSGIPNDVPGFLLIVRLLGHLSDLTRRDYVPRPAEDGRNFLVTDHDHFVVNNAAGHGRISARIA